MITLTFLVCLASNECVSQAPPQVFQSVAQCEVMAQMVMADMDRKMAEGLVPAHAASYKCVNWGQPS